MVLVKAKRDEILGPLSAVSGIIERRHTLPILSNVLIDRSAEGDRHRLRFRADATTRRRLEEIVAAEAKCCSFLDFSLEERGGELVLWISAPEEGKPVADELGAAFAGRRRR